MLRQGDDFSFWLPFEPAPAEVPSNTQTLSNCRDMNTGLDLLPSHALACNTQEPSWYSSVHWRSASGPKDAWTETTRGRACKPVFGVRLLASTRAMLVPCALRLVPCALRLVPCALRLVPCALRLVPCALHFACSSLAQCILRCASAPCKLSTNVALRKRSAKDAVCKLLCASTLCQLRCASALRQFSIRELLCPSARVFMNDFL